MATHIERLSAFTSFAEVTQAVSVETFQNIFEENRHRIYSLAFWMTDNELAAEEVSTRVFCRAFSGSPQPSADQINVSLLKELRDLMPIGVLTLHLTSTSTRSVRGNVKRIHMERAVVQIPSTERLAFLLHDVEGYDAAKTGSLLGLTAGEVKEAVHQARLLMRELIADMQP
jgi:DNA-directed RNA polymerase specialized sigma24 family protein